MTFFVFSVLPAPDSPLQVKRTRRTRQRRRRRRTRTKPPQCAGACGNTHVQRIDWSSRSATRQKKENVFIKFEVLMGNQECSYIPVPGLCAVWSKTTATEKARRNRTSQSFLEFPRCFRTTSRNPPILNKILAMCLPPDAHFRILSA